MYMYMNTIVSCNNQTPQIINSTKTLLFHSFYDIFNGIAAIEKRGIQCNVLKTNALFAYYTALQIPGMVRFLKRLPFVFSEYAPRLSAKKLRSLKTSKSLDYSLLSRGRTGSRRTRSQKGGGKKWILLLFLCFFVASVRSNMYVQFGSIGEIFGRLNDTSSSSVGLSELQSNLSQTGVASQIATLRQNAVESELPQINVASLLLAATQNVYGSCGFNAKLFMGERSVGDLLGELSDSVETRIHTDLPNLESDRYFGTPMGAASTFVLPAKLTERESLVKSESLKLLESYKQFHYLKTEGREASVSINKKLAQIDNQLQDFASSSSSSSSGANKADISSLLEEKDRLSEAQYELYQSSQQSRIPAGMVFMHMCGFSTKTSGHAFICLLREAPDGSIKTGVIDTNFYPYVVYNSVIDILHKKGPSTIKAHRDKKALQFIRLENGFLTEQETESEELMSMVTLQSNPFSSALKIYESHGEPIQRITIFSGENQMPANTFPINNVSISQLFDIVKMQHQLIHKIDDAIVAKLSYFQRAKLFAQSHLREL